MGHKNDRMVAILERLNNVMDMTLPSNTSNLHSKSHSSNNSNGGCQGWDCFSKLNEKVNITTEYKHEDEIAHVVKEYNNVFHDSWWQGGDQDSIHWEAAALGLASIFIGLGMVGLLLSICSACLRQRRAQMMISRHSRKRARAERYSAVADGRINRTFPLYYHEQLNESFLNILDLSLLPFH